MQCYCGMPYTVRDGDNLVKKRSFTWHKWQTDGFCVRENPSPTELCVFNRFLKRPKVAGSRSDLEKDYLQVLTYRDLRGKRAASLPQSHSSEGPHTWTRAGQAFPSGGRSATTRSVRMKNRTESQSPRRHQGTFGKFSLEGLQKPTRKLHWSLGNPDLRDGEGGNPENTGLHSCFLLQFPLCSVKAMPAYLKGLRHRAFLQRTFINHHMPERWRRKWRKDCKRVKGAQVLPSDHPAGIAAPPFSGSQPGSCWSSPPQLYFLIKRRT